MKIEVLGSGCASCKRLFEVVSRIVEEEGIVAKVEYSDDISKIVELGLMRSPVLVVDGKPVDFRSASEKDVRNALCGEIVDGSSCCASGVDCCFEKDDSEPKSECSCGGNC